MEHLVTINKSFFLLFLRKRKLLLRLVVCYRFGCAFSSCTPKKVMQAAKLIANAQHFYLIASYALKRG